VKYYVQINFKFCRNSISGRSLPFGVNAWSFIGVQCVSALFDENLAVGYLQLLWKTRGGVLAPGVSREVSGLIVIGRMSNEKRPMASTFEVELETSGSNHAVTAPYRRWSRTSNTANLCSGEHIMRAAAASSCSHNRNPFHIVRTHARARAHTHTHTSSISSIPPSPSVLHHYPSFFPHYLSRFLYLLITRKYLPFLFPRR
jgi:hypothetical protein